LGNIIIGLLDPTKGQLFIDDILINSQNKSSWYKSISIIPQNIFLNDVSIAENIAIGIDPKEIDLEKVKNAAKQAQIHDFIESTPNQYNEKVGERGIKLSGGQRQRIGIARALYREAKVILFDEATNQLDTNTESLIVQSINNLDKEITIILIAHRLSTLKDCDQIINLSKI
jgi:ABC-type multidrug transport system fused ATPase/permease subunit